MADTNNQKSEHNISNKNLDTSAQEQRPANQQSGQQSQQAAAQSADPLVSTPLASQQLNNKTAPEPIRLDDGFTTESDNSSPKKPDRFASAKTKFKNKFILTALTVVLMIGASALAAVYAYLNNQPEKVLADALANSASDMLEQKPWSMIGRLIYKSGGDNPIQFTIKFTGQNLSANGKLSADITIDFADQVYRVNTAAMVIGESEAYFKFDNLKSTLKDVSENQPAFSFYTSMADSIVEKFDNQWIRITEADLKKIGLTNEQQVDKCTAAISSLRLNQTDNKELKRIFKSNQFITARETLPNETISNESSFHYRLDFNSKAARDFTKQIIDIESFKSVKSDCGVTDQVVADGLNRLEGDSRRIDANMPIIDLWVGKKSRRPTKISVQTSDKNATLDFAGNIKFDAKNITVIKPKNSLPLAELQSEIEKLMLPIANAL